MAQPQRISSMPYSQEGFVLSSEKNGLGAMLPQNQGMTNATAGLGAVPGAPYQQRQNIDYLAQSNNQNLITKNSGEIADAIGQVRKDATEKSTAQHLLTTTLSDVVYNELMRKGGDSYLFALNTALQGPGGSQFVTDIGVGKKMGEMLG